MGCGTPRARRARRAPGKGASKALGATTDGASKRKLLPSRRMILSRELERAIPAKLLPSGSSRTDGKFVLRYLLDVKIVVASLTEVCRTETIPDRHGAAVTALELKILLAMSWTHRGTRGDRTPRTYKLRWVKVALSLSCAFVVASKVRLVALVAQVVGINMHGITLPVPGPSPSRDSLVVVFAFVCESLQRLGLHGGSEFNHGLQKKREAGRSDVLPTQGAHKEAKSDPGTNPTPTDDS